MRTMRARGILGLVVVALAACGRTELDRTDGTPKSVDPLCHDATLAGAATPALGFCSDGAHRAPVVAPRAPVARWTVTVPEPSSFLVDAEGDILGSTWAITPSGALRSTPARGRHVAYLDRAGAVVGTEIEDAHLVVAYRTPAGSLLRSLTPPNPQHLLNWSVLGAAASDGTVDLGWSIQGPLSRTIGIVQRLDGDRTAFSASTGCVPIDGDRSRPAAVIRLADGTVASACGSFNATVRLTFIDSSGVAAPTLFLDGSDVASNLAQLPNGDIALVTRDSNAEMTLSVVRGSVVRSRTRVPSGRSADLAVARNGTILVRTESQLFAFAPNTPTAALLYRVDVPRTEVDDPMGGVSPSSLFVDADATVVTWGDRIEARSLDDGSLRWSFADPGRSEFTSVTAAGPGAIYALTRSATMTLLRDP
jgi:hypothetical protein